MATVSAIGSRCRKGWNSRRPSRKIGRCKMMRKEGQTYYTLYRATFERAEERRHAGMCNAAPDEYIRCAKAEAARANRQTMLRMRAALP